MQSSRGDFKATLPRLVVDHITAAMPNAPVERANVSRPRGLVLADPDFDTPGPIDLLIGAGLFWDLLCIGQFRVGVGNLVWQKTRLGWVLGGRGLCRAIHSDNGTNFIGARNALNDLGHLLASQVHNDRFSQALAEEQVEWHLIPPRAPHFGGLWERGVSSVKAHLKRVIGEQRLTLKSYPSDFTPLTPGHFLVGETLTALPQTDLTEVPHNRLSRFQLLQQTIQF
ncbi:uncharacterized protein LOC144478011 [Augochlora pura]